uniref:Reverse transcriptase domain-containing protein n=1 Tax=Tanacetum cinerariifolium TaxID=118510 RepID=A0A699K2T2_TANCI|nr:hypothetical protein [Tanacetum cinerariifolium]
MGVLLAKERILKLIQDWDKKQIKSWRLPELLIQLSNDSRTIDEMLKQREQAANLAVQKEQEEQAAQSFTPYWNYPMIDDEEVLQAREKFMKAIQIFLKKFNKRYQPEEIQELMCKLFEDVRNSNEELSEFTNSSSWDRPMIVNEKEHSIQFSDDESLSNEDVPKENFKIYSSPLFDDEESIFTKIDPHYFNAESNLLKSLLNRDTLIDSSPKFDFLLEEFSGELAHIDPISSGIEEFDLEEEIRLIENLLYDNSSPRPLKKLNAEIANTIVESLSISYLY